MKANSVIRIVAVTEKLETRGHVSEKANPGGAHIIDMN
ncbi:MAG: hypothetical protein K0S45_2809 [Nitrospira sp.]|jgi:hypothetical protein|nr:hypothetical protein [Nitrospira sp.]